MSDPTADAARQRLALQQVSLLAALVAGAPAPEGFDPRRIRVQSRALAAKRAGVVAKVAPELPGILGDGYHSAFLRYAATGPMAGGHRLDALRFVEGLLTENALPAPVRRELYSWWKERSGAAPPPDGRLRRLLRTTSKRK